MTPCRFFILLNDERTRKLFLFSFVSYQCSVSCGEGLRQREVICMKKLQDDSLQILHPSQCLENEKPDTEELCTQEHCGTLWYMTDWSKVKYKLAAKRENLSLEFPS